ncbi:MAG: sensor domain-containing diguanylate cyclase [Herminiimonas sp.]|nr:sensor domain-containing diguanylate cyclase [Herminiimonas sp.]
MLPEMRCPLPEDEPQRISAVRSYEILDTEPEVEFDALTRVVAHAFNAPIAVVAMMDTDRLWFKSKLGLAVPELDRKIAFCAHAIMCPRQPLIVNDLLNDRLFADNPLVADAPHLRFYAGAPIVDPSGYALGTVAVIDIEPRTFTDSQRHTLSDFATLVMTAIQARKRALVLERMAMTDYLTGIPNRAQFDKTITTEIGYADRSATSLSVMFLDLDGFKDVNDRVGHAAGDEVLREVARRLTQEIRMGDVLARLGGDEFAVITREGDQAAIAAMARRFVAAVQKPITLSTGQQVNVGISFGIASYGGASTSAFALLQEADKALYEAKSRSRRVQGAA